MKRKAVCSFAAFCLALTSMANICTFAQEAKTSVNAEQKKGNVIITVGHDESCDFQSIQEAVDSIDFTPSEDKRAIISIKTGEYEEVVNINTPYVTLTNADSKKPEDVVITFDRAASHENPEKKFGTQQSATVTADTNAIGFCAENITIQNSYNLNQPNLGDDGGRGQTQAVALVTMCDKVVLRNCNFLGRQDTLYLKGASKGADVYGDSNPARVYVEKCLIEGTVDYIFGDATAYFYDCDLNMAYYKNGGHYTAANTTLFNIGYVFDSCRLTADKKYDEFTGDKKKNVDLGRPWQGDATYPNYGSQTVFINCSMPEDIISKSGFSAWNETTVTNKIRYYEYGSTDEKGNALDLSERIPWEKVLTAEQAKAYNAYNVLRGNDNWNPAKAKSTVSRVADVTLSKYKLEIPKGESDSIKAFVLPIVANNKAVKFSSSDKNVALVDENSGAIKALKEGTATITATTVENGFKVSCEVTVLPERTKAPEVSEISIKADGAIAPNTVLTGKYSYKDGGDFKKDCAKVKWYAVDKDGKETLVQEGRGAYAKSYTIKGADIGSSLKFIVEPETTTTYGDKGEAASAISSVVTAPAGYTGKTYLREGFNDFDKTSAEKGSENANTTWIKSSAQPLADGTNSFNSIVLDGNPTVGGGTTDLTTIEYNPKANEEAWKDVSLEARMIFNPNAGGFASNCYYNIYTNYNKEKGSYYKLNISRGSNTNSLVLALYKNDGKGGEDVLLAKDDTSLTNKVPQNSGDNNPWFRIKETNKGGKINVEFTLEGDTAPLAVLTAEDNEPVADGFIAFDNYGKINVLLNDYILCEKAE